MVRRGCPRSGRTTRTSSRGTRTSSPSGMRGAKSTTSQAQPPSSKRVERTFVLVRYEPCAFDPCGLRTGRRKVCRPWRGREAREERRRRSRRRGRQSHSMARSSGGRGPGHGRVATWLQVRERRRGGRLGRGGRHRVSETGDGAAQAARDGPGCKFSARAGRGSAAEEWCHAAVSSVGAASPSGARPTAASVALRGGAVAKCYARTNSPRRRRASVTLDRGCFAKRAEARRLQRGRRARRCAPGPCSMRPLFSPASDTLLRLGLTAAVVQPRSAYRSR